MGEGDTPFELDARLERTDGFFADGRIRVDGDGIHANGIFVPRTECIGSASEPLSYGSGHHVRILQRTGTVGRLCVWHVRTSTEREAAALGRRGRCMSENTVNADLRSLGYGSDEMTGHGFRSMAATRLNEMGWNADAIERQLAHAETNKVRAAYTHAAQYLDERKRMMQAWADYLDGLKRGNGLP